MRSLIFLTLLTLPSPRTPILAAETGITAVNLSTTPTTNGINMEGSRTSNQLSLTLAVTPGTTTIVDVRCFESQDATNYDPIAMCNTASPAACAPDVRRYTLSDYTGTVRYISTRWAITKKYAKCSADDPNDGTGTVTITGSRSWQ